MEVVQRATAEEDRVCERSVPGVNFAGLPFGSVTVTVRKFAWIASSAGRPCIVTR
jgi:hypothetical protein